MTDNKHRTIYRKDYTPPNYLVDNVEIRFELGDEITTVISRMTLRSNYDPALGQRPLVLDGHRFVLRTLSLDGALLPVDRYVVSAEQLTIERVPSRFALEVVTELRPQENTFLEGLYCSNGMFCTQCEAEGFRAITYYPDRPDVLAVFTATIVASRLLHPVLLSNGNLIASGELPDGLHYATWHDPFKKPCYLFALVAGDLVCIEESFTTCSNRTVDLRLYLQAQNRNKGGHALQSLRKAMAWDEVTFGREYDLDIYMIVAVDDFNMGAMENKGLNIFNSRYVLASPATATDDDFQAIEEVVGHEYFHNWSGNRVTCRDWFQLSLKEGLTIFRDQEFSADMESRGVKRIADVRYLRTAQFPEDAGPLAHPVRPDSYMEINNFYTTTVYNKGAEVIRMLLTLLGTERFRKGMDLYFERHDGKATTVDDFIEAMTDAGGRDLEQFSQWYSQAGTPRIDASGSFDYIAGTFTLTVRQATPPTPGQQEKNPLHIPLLLGLLDRDGQQLPITFAGEREPGPTTRLLEIKTAEQRFVFSGLDVEPVPVLFRNFSAPVHLSYPYRHDDLLLIMAHEPDPFSRWEAGQQLATNLLLSLVADWQAGRELHLDSGFVTAFRAIITSEITDRAFQAEALTLPTEAYLAELMPVTDPDAVHGVRQFVRRRLATELQDEFLALRSTCRPGVRYRVDDGRTGERRLANLCLAYLMTLESQPMIDLCVDQYQSSDNMTDTMGALVPLASCDCPDRRKILAGFYECWRDDRLVVDKWFSVQATSMLPDTLATVTSLLAHPAFELTNPNRFRSLVGAFSQGNLACFHDRSGAGYRLLSDQILRLIPVNPQVSARLLTPLTRWQRYDSNRQLLMRAELERILDMPELPRDVYEIVAKSLAK